MRRQRAQADHQRQDQQQHEQMQRIKPDQPGAQEGAIAAAVAAAPSAAAIGMGEDEARQDEEELDPQIAAGGDDGRASRRPV